MLNSGLALDNVVFDFSAYQKGKVKFATYFQESNIFRDLLKKKNRLTKFESMKPILYYPLVESFNCKRKCF